MVWDSTDEGTLGWSRKESSRLHAPKVCPAWYRVPDGFPPLQCTMPFDLDGVALARNQFDTIRSD